MPAPTAPWTSIAGFAVQLGRGRPGLLPMVFFVLAALLGTIGAGNIGAVALLAPIGMAVAHEAGVPPFLMALMIACGGNAAALSPLAPTGVIAVELMQKISLPNSGWHNYLHCLLAHTLVGFRNSRSAASACFATAPAPSKPAASKPCWRLVSSPLPPAIC